MAQFKFVRSHGRFIAQQEGSGCRRFPEGAQPPPVILEAAGLDGNTGTRTFVAAGPELFASFAVRVFGEAGSGPHTAHISAEDGAANVSPRGQAPVTALAALQQAGFDVEICE